MAVEDQQIQAAGSKHRGPRRIEELGPHYKWIALSNTTLGILMATINSSIVLIALPDIFRGININPLEGGNSNYLLWMIMGFLVVTAVLVVGFSAGSATCTGAYGCTTSVSRFSRSRRCSSR